MAPRFVLEFLRNGVISPCWSGLRETVVTTRITLDPREAARYDWLAESELEDLVHGREFAPDAVCRVCRAEPGGEHIRALPAPRRPSCRARWGVLLYEDEVLRGLGYAEVANPPKVQVSRGSCLQLYVRPGPRGIRVPTRSRAHRQHAEELLRNPDGFDDGPGWPVRQAGRRSPANGGKNVEQNRLNGVSRRGLIRGGLLAVAASGVAVVGLAGPASAAVINLGLDKQGAQRIQRWILTMYGYKGKIDGCSEPTVGRRCSASWRLGPTSPFPTRVTSTGSWGPRRSRRSRPT